MLNAPKATDAAATLPPTLGVEAARPEPPAQPPADRALDQWRGLALLMVLVSHGAYDSKQVPGIGRVGVNLFFFISGILVFRSLARGPQQVRAGTWNLWTRRARRLMPANYFFLACIWLLVLLPWIQPYVANLHRDFLKALPSALAFGRNFFMYHIDPDGSEVNECLTHHLWSVGCEMQFYLLAPLIFFAGGRANSRRSLVYGLILLALVACGMSVMWREHYNQYAFLVAVWPMMAGFFAEFLRQTYPKVLAPWGKLLALCAVIGFTTLLPTLICFNWAGGSGHLLRIYKYGVVLAGTLLVPGCLGCYLRGWAPENVVTRVFHWLGNRTYSIYLWQQPLTIGGFFPPAFHPFGALLAIPVGALSFLFLEKPFMSKFRKGREAAI